MMFLNLIRLTLLSSSIILIDAASVPKSDPTNPVTKKNNTTKLDESPLPTGTPSDNLEGSKSGIGCFIDGQRYFEGQFMPDVGGPCHACYCLRGRQQCSEMRCRPPVKGCTPVMAKGKCCPVRYDCETNENVVSRTNGKLPRGDLLPEFGFKFDFDYDNSDIDDRVMENHVRIERQSENEPQEVLGDVVTTELPVTVDEETTIDSVPAVHVSTHPANETNAEMEILKVSEDPFVKDIENTDEYLSGGNDKLDSELQFVEEPILDDNLQVESNIEDVVHQVVVPYNSSISEIATENPDIEYYYDYEEEDATKVPTLSITDILSKLRTQNEGSVGTLADILPAPITGTRVENDSIPEKTLTNEPETSDKNDFVSYDIDVGTSMIAGKDDAIVGVGHVIPIDLHSEAELPVSRPFQPPRTRFTSAVSTTSEISTTASTTTTTAAATTTTTTTAATADDLAPITTESDPEIDSVSSTSKYSTTEKTKPQSSFLDTFLNLFRGGKPGEKAEKPGSSQFAPPSFTEQPPPPFLNPPISRDENLNADIFESPLGPPSFFRPPPMDDNAPVSGDIFEDEFVSDTKNELDGELDLDSKPTIDNEIRTRPKPPNGSITRNELPIRRRPTTTATGSKPFYPGLFSSRPKLTSSNTQDDIEVGGAADENIPSDPFVEEGGFAAIRPTSLIRESVNEEPILESDDPTLPPSLPNLKIIPFVAADALVNQGSPPDDGTSGGFSPRPFGSSSSTQDCREGGKVWKNGEAVAKGNNDPCVLCRCLQGKVICQHLECPTLPKGCTAEETPAEGECCPKLTYDESANVSIVDTLPSFRPIKDETEDAPSNPIRPSPFSHQNRRPPFNSSSRRPPLSKSSISISPRKPLIPPRLRPTKKPSNEEETKITEEEDDSSKTEPIRPVRPFSRPSILKPLRNSVPQLTGSRPRPFSYQNRTGSRPSFVPPRRSNPHLLPTTEASDSAIIDDSEPQDVVSQKDADMTSILESRAPPREQPAEISPQREDPTDFDHLFAGLLDKDSLPQPIHRDRDQFEDDKPFILPSDILIPKPFPPQQINNEGLEGEITNFVKQDKFRFTESASPGGKIGSIIRIQKPAKRLPEIPEVVKAQLPLGNDPILVSGLFELGGCNVYGRMFEIGEEIQEISGQCKACQCTKVGVQCLPIC